MKALLFSNLFPSACEPTRGVFNLQRFRALSDHCEVRVVSPLPWWSRLRRPAEWIRTPEERSTGLQAAFPTYWSVPGAQGLHAFAMNASLRPYLLGLRREFPFDVILAAWAYPDAAAAARFARTIGCPLVTMVLGSDVNGFTQKPALKAQIRSTLNQSRRVVAVSRALRDRVIDLGIPSDRIVVQHNGVDGNRFTPHDRRDARSRLGLPLDGPVVAYVGNFKAEKGVDVLVDAMGHVKRGGRPDVRLALVGSGYLEGDLRSQVDRLGLHSQVDFHGRQPHASIPLWIAASDVFCLPSHREGCPNVVLEALASGRPVVASEVGGVPELLSDSTGVMVPAGDPARLAGGLIEALERQWDPFALRNSVEYLSWDRFGRTLKETLEAAIDDRPDGRVLSHSMREGRS